MKRTDYLKTFIMIMVMLLTSLSNISAQSDGIPDPDFVNGGNLQVSYLSSRTYSGVVLDDDSFIAAGREFLGSAEHGLLMMKFKYNGIVDSSFGTDGVVSFQVNGEENTPAVTILEDPDGKLTVFGYIYNYRTYMLKFNADGSLDETWGNNGQVLFDFGFAPIYRAYGAIALDNGKYMVTGSRFNGADFEYFVLRVNADGTPDESFGSFFSEKGLRVYRPIGPNENSYGHSLYMYEDGSFLTAGVAQTLSRYEGILMKCKADGTVDSSFGENGIAFTGFFVSQSDGDDMRFNVKVSPDGYIYLPGYDEQIGVSNGKDIAVIRFTPDGMPDASFGTDGIAYYDFEYGTDFGRCVAIQEDGKILLGGEVDINSKLQFGLVRFNTDGTVDESFAGAGAVTSTYGRIPHSIFFRSGGKILMMGTNDYGFAAVSYLNPGGATSIAPIDNAIVNNYSLEQNYPNPFNPSTKIRFSIPNAQHVKLTVYNTLGEKVDEPVNQTLSPGSYEFNWNAEGLPSGVYIYSVATDNYTSSKKMLLLK